MPTITLLENTANNFELPYGTPLTELDKVLMFGCRMASCGACTIEIISGRENLSTMQSAEKNFLDDIGLGDGTYRLACQCRVLGDVVLKQC